MRDEGGGRITRKTALKTLGKVEHLKKSAAGRQMEDVTMRFRKLTMGGINPYAGELGQGSMPLIARLQSNEQIQFPPWRLASVPHKSSLEGSASVLTERSRSPEQNATGHSAHERMLTNPLPTGVFQRPKSLMRRGLTCLLA